MQISALKFHFLKNYLFFRRDYANTSPTHTHSVYRSIMSKKRALHLFLKITFFSSLLLLLTSETLPHHLFRQTSDQKWLKNLPKRGKFFFTFCYNFFLHFPSPLTEKNKTTYFFRIFYHRKQKNRKGKRPIKNFSFLFFFFYFFASYCSS